MPLGNPGGSLEASRRSFNKDFLLALTADFKKHGASAIEKVRKQQPAAYMKICALLVRGKMRVEHSGGVKAMTDEQLEQGIEAIRAMLAAREAGENAKVIDAVVAGETFVVTRNGEPVAELRPIRTGRRVFISRDDVAALSDAAVRIDHRQFRADLDRLIDQGL